MDTTNAVRHTILTGKGMTSFGQETQSHTNLRKVSVHIHTIRTKIICTEQTRIDMIYTLNAWIQKIIIR